MRRGMTGYYAPLTQVGERCKAFVPHPLPPDPPILLRNSLALLLDEATLALGRLDGVSSLLPDVSALLYSYVRKEAVLSSQIEGTQSSLSDLMLFEVEGSPGVPMDDVQEVSSYVGALEYGIKRLRTLPISSRLLREVHGVLLSKGRGSDKEPGEFKRSQNWIGGTRPGNALYIPTPPELVNETMGALEKFLHDRKSQLPLLIKAGLAHVQFETIHPFLDGNGRMGRLLITLLLCAEGALANPLLYLSLYFKEHRKTYYDFLQKVRFEGTWEVWLEFFLKGVKETAEEAVQTARELLEIFARDKAKIEALGRPAGSALRVHQSLQKKPLNSVSRIAKETGISVVTVTASLKNLEKLGIVQEVTGGKYGRLYGYTRFIEKVGKGT